MRRAKVLPIVLLIAAPANGLRAQDGTVECAANIKQIAVVRAADMRTEVKVCASPNEVIVLTNPGGNIPAQARGCPANLNEVGLGDNPRVISQRQPDGRIAIRVNSSRDPSCWIVAILPFMEQQALPNTTAPGGGQGGGIFSSGNLTVTAVTVTDPATRQLIRSRKQGPGSMTVVVPRDSELAALFHSGTGSNRRIAKAELQFENALLVELGFPASATSASVVLEDIEVMKIMDRSSPMDGGMPLSLNFEKMTWTPRR